jgi:heterodisulfide reductase subunit C
MPHPTAIVLSPNNEFLSFVQRQTGESITACYQCGKCSAGCPTAYAMDITPRQVMRGIQLGLKDEMLSSSAIWLCVSCQTCSLRCPREIDIAKVMESLRILSLAEGRAPGQRNIATLYSSFMQDVLLFGRVYETGLGMLYNLRSMQLLNNVARLPALFSRGKLKLKPRRIGVAEVKQIAARVKEIEKQGGKL